MLQVYPYCHLLSEKEGYWDGRLGIWECPSFKSFAHPTGTCSFKLPFQESKSPGFGNTVHPPLQLKRFVVPKQFAPGMSNWWPILPSPVLAPCSCYRTGRELCWKEGRRQLSISLQKQIPSPQKQHQIVGKEHVFSWVNKAGWSRQVSLILCERYVSDTRLCRQAVTCYSSEPSCAHTLSAIPFYRPMKC